MDTDMRLLIAIIFSALSFSVHSESKLNDNSVDGNKQKISQSDYQYIFCHKFSQIEWQMLGSLLVEEIEKTPFPTDDYFKIAACQPGGYSAAVKSPLLHIIADDPSKRMKFLNILWAYYTKRRKEPAIFTEIVNAKNTKGETLLDYIETMVQRGNYSSDGSKEAIAQIVSTACSHGAIYSAYPKKKCP